MNQYEGIQQPLNYGRLKNWKYILQSFIFIFFVAYYISLIIAPIIFWKFIIGKGWIESILGPFFSNLPQYFMVINSIATLIDIHRGCFTNFKPMEGNDLLL